MLVLVPLTSTIYIFYRHIAARACVCAITRPAWSFRRSVCVLWELLCLCILKTVGGQLALQTETRPFSRSSISLTSCNTEHTGQKQPTQQE